MKKLPENARFPVPSGPHAAWSPEDWYDWWKMTGGRRDPNPPYVNPKPMPPRSFRDTLRLMKDIQNNIQDGA
tara:strand:+ start:249 stop:464 length:216 start_codon:yes stop_codon:yes gene_type:complete